MHFAVRIEKYKKKYDIQTYKEIVAFTHGKSLDEIEKAREEGKRPYQKVLVVAGSIRNGPSFLKKEYDPDQTIGNYYWGSNLLRMQ